MENGNENACGVTNVGSLDNCFFFHPKFFISHVTDEEADRSVSLIVCFPVVLLCPSPAWYDMVFFPFPARVISAMILL